MLPAQANRRPRAGITLIEILISIMILGIGLVSLATLFPIGLLWLRDAQRQSRSAFLAESAQSDMAARALLVKSTFLDPAFSPWYTSQTPSGHTRTNPTTRSFRTRPTFTRTGRVKAISPMPVSTAGLEASAQALRPRSQSTAPRAQSGWLVQGFRSLTTPYCGR